MSTPTYFLLCPHEYTQLHLRNKEIGSKLEDETFRKHLSRHYINDDCIKILLTLENSYNNLPKINWIDSPETLFRWSSKSVESLILNYKIEYAQGRNDSNEFWNKIADDLNKDGHKVSALKCQSKMNSLKLMCFRMKQSLEPVDKYSDNWHYYRLLKKVWRVEDYTDLQCSECTGKNGDTNINESMVFLNEQCGKEETEASSIKKQNCVSTMTKNLEQSVEGHVTTSSRNEEGAEQLTPLQVRLSVLRQEQEKMIQAICVRMKRDTKLSKKITCRKQQESM